MIFLLDDALGRLADVKGRQDEMADEAAWAALSDRQKLERERRLEAVKRTAKGFLELAKARRRHPLCPPAPCPPATHCPPLTPVALLSAASCRRRSPPCST